MMERVKVIINEILITNGKNLPNFELNESTRLREDLGLDSFNLAELTVHIEEEFGVDIFRDGLVNTLGEVFNKLEGKSND